MILKTSVNLSECRQVAAVWRVATCTAVFFRTKLSHSEQYSVHRHFVGEQSFSATRIYKTTADIMASLLAEWRKERFRIISGYILETPVLGLYIVYKCSVIITNWVSVDRESFWYILLVIHFLPISLSDQSIRTRTVACCLTALQHYLVY